MLAPNRQSKALTKIEAGMIARLNWGLKLVADYNFVTDYSDILNIGRVQVSKSLGKDFTLNSDFTYAFNEKTDTHNSNLNIKWFF